MSCCYPLLFVLLAARVSMCSFVYSVPNETYITNNSLTILSEDRSSLHACFWFSWCIFVLCTLHITYSLWMDSRFESFNGMIVKFVLANGNHKQTFSMCQWTSPEFKLSNRLQSLKFIYMQCMNMICVSYAP